jgi:hypothetical protein
MPRRRLIRYFALLAAGCAVCGCFAAAQIDNDQRAVIPFGPYRIAGTAINAKAGSPLARARVSISDSKNRQDLQSLITGNDGRFEFHVPSGKYDLFAAKRGYIPASYNQHEQFSTAIVTGADLDTENLVLRLAPDAVLTGRVLDEFGDPVRQAQVMVYREFHAQGVSRVVQFRTAGTDDQGRYEVTPLNEGTYFVSAKASPWYAVHPQRQLQNAADSPQVATILFPSHVDPSLDVAYAITYYGDVTESDEAAPIPVRGGDRLEADIHLKPVPALHLLLHVATDGSSVSLPHLEKSAFQSLETISSEIVGIAPGVFELTGVAAGRYSVVTHDAGGEMKELAESNLSSGELDLSSAKSTSKITAKVQIEGSSTVPASFQVAMREKNGRPMVSRVDAKGEANFANVGAGKYDFAAWSDTQRYSVVRIATEGGVISGRSLNVVPGNVASGASLSVVLSLVGGSVTVEGYAKRDGKAASGVMIVLVPKNPAENRDRFRRDQSDLDGSFGLPNVIPGEYSIVAIDDGWDLDWAEPSVIAAYLAKAQSINVGAQVAGTMHLTDAVKVQNK